MDFVDVSVYNYHHPNFNSFVNITACAVNLDHNLYGQRSRLHHVFKVDYLQR